MPPPATLTRAEGRAIAQRLLADLRDLPRAHLLEQYSRPPEIDFDMVDPVTGKPYMALTFVRELPRSAGLEICVMVNPPYERRFRRPRGQLLQGIFGDGLRWLTPVHACASLPPEG